MGSTPLLKRDEMGLGVGPVPYVTITLDKNESELIKDKTLDFYSIENQFLFDIKDKDGNRTGQKAFFVIFK